MSTAPPSSRSGTADVAPWRAADAAMRRLLRIPVTVPVRRPELADVHRAFSRSMLISATRCLLTYVVLPFLAPALGLAAGVGPWIGIPLSGVAIVFNVVSIRRFWLVNHRWRWGYTALGVGVIGLLAVLMAVDLSDVVG